MNGSDPVATFDRLRAAFRPPGPFGAPHDGVPAGDAPPAAGLRLPPTDPEEPPRFDPGLPGVRVLAIVGLVAALAAGACLWWSRPSPRPVADAAPSPAARLSPAAPEAAAEGRAAAAVPGPSPSAVTVDVAGKVRHPGVVTLPAGARVIDAIRAAGGLRSGAQPGTLNLARVLADGEQILVGITAPPDPGAGPGLGGAPPGAGAAPGGAPLDLNTATVAQLDQLPGVGPVLAQRIVDYRTRHGSFRTVEELRQVSGIGPAKFSDLKGLVRV